MISTVLISYKKDFLHLLKQKAQQLFPILSINGDTTKTTEIPLLISNVKPQLIVIDYELYAKQPELETYRYTNQSELIFTSDTSTHAIDAFQYSAAGYVLKPLDDSCLKIALNNAINRIQVKESIIENEIVRIINLSRTMTNKPVFIPTMDGFELLTVGQIIRCKGERGTTILTTTESTGKPIIRSSYNIGVFRQELEKYGFYSPHKSHLINPVFIRKYSKEGFIYMNNGDKIPLARRKKCEFLNRIPNICNR